MIKVIKRKTQDDIADAPSKRIKATVTTVATTVNDWISESRKNKLQEDDSSRETIAGWVAEPST